MSGKKGRFLPMSHLRRGFHQNYQSLHYKFCHFFYREFSSKESEFNSISDDLAFKKTQKANL